MTGVEVSNDPKLATVITHPRFSGNSTGGISGGGDGGSMEPRIAALESTVRHIDTQITDIKIDIREQRSDSKHQFYAGITAVVVIFGAIIFVFFKLSDRLDSVVTKLSEMQLTIQQVSDSVTKKTP